MKKIFTLIAAVFTLATVTSCSKEAATVEEGTEETVDVVVEETTSDVPSDSIVEEMTTEPVEVVNE